MKPSVVVLALVGVVACKPKADVEAPGDASAPVVTSATASASASASTIVATPSASASSEPPKTVVVGDVVAPIPGGDAVRLPTGRMAKTDTCPTGYAGPLAPDNKCHKTCSSPHDCASANCDMAASVHVCMAAVSGPTVGVPAPKGGDCANGWMPSVTEANKCDKECTTDAQCGVGNKCKAVGPIGSGKQCQKG